MTPKQTADYLATSQAGIKGLSPGPDTQAFLEKKRAQLRLLNAGRAWNQDGMAAAGGVCRAASGLN